MRGSRCVVLKDEIRFMLKLNDRLNDPFLCMIIIIQINEAMI